MKDAKAEMERLKQAKEESVQDYMGAFPNHSDTGGDDDGEAAG